MYILWKLVLLAVISTGPSRGIDLENTDDLNKEKSNQRTFLSKYDITSQSKFQCQNKPSGYYADPQYDCKVFHYCQEDGTKMTIPCILDTEEHKICVFRDVVSNACEGSEIYLALPEDLQAKTSKETTASTIINATDFKLSSVLPIPLSPENNHSTTPLSLDFSKRNNSDSLFNTKETDSIFEVINNVLREIRTESNDKLPNHSKLTPASFRRGSRQQASSIKRDDTPDSLQAKDDTKIGDAFLVEVYKKKNGKITGGNTPYYKKSKKLYFLPKLENKTPATNPRRKKRTVAEPLNVSRPYAVIYAKVPDNTRFGFSGIEKKSSNQRLDLLEVPFVPARVPADVPTIPITIETRRRKKSKSKKKPKNFSHAIFFQENIPQETGHEQTSEQQNILFFAPEENPRINLQSTRSRTTSNNQQRPQHNSEQSEKINTPLSSNSESPQNNVQSNHQTSLSDQGAIPLQIPNFPFNPTTFLTDSDIPQYYFPSEDIPISENFPSLSLQDQYVLQQQQQPRQTSFILPNNAPSQSVRLNKPETQTRQRDNNVPQRTRQIQNSQHQNVPQQENRSNQINRYPNNNAQSTRQQEHVSQTIRPENSPQNIRKPEVYYSQPEYNLQTYRQPENIPQSYRQSGNIRPQTGSQPENIFIHTVRETGNVQGQTPRQPESVQGQNLRQPENVNSQALRQPGLTHSQTVREPQNRPDLRPPESIHTQVFRNPENSQPQSFRYTVGIQPQTIGQPEYIQPQSLGQLQNIYLQNLPTFPFGHDGLQQSIRQPRPGEQTLVQNSPNDGADKEKSERERQPQQHPQTYAGFESPFFQQFSNFGFNNPFGHHAPQSFDVLPPNTIRYQEHNPSQHTQSEDKTQGSIPQQVEKPQDQNIRHIISERPQNLNSQQYGNQLRQHIPNNRDPAINHPGSNTIRQQQQNLNPNVVGGERVIQERPGPVHENISPQNFVSAPEISGTSRNRGRTTVVTASTTRPPTRQRSRAQPTSPPERYNTRRPQENTRQQQRYQEPPQQSNYHRRPTQAPRSTSEVVYHPQYEPEVSVSQVTNDIHNRYPTTVTASDLRYRQTPKPHSTRDDQRDENLRQRQRNRQYYYDSNNRQTQPQYSTRHSSSTTPLPSSTARERTRRPEYYQSHGTYQQNPRQVNKESATEEDKPYYRYKTTPSSYTRSRTRISTTREQPTEKPVTSMYFVTSTPRYRQTEEVTYSRRPHQFSETQHEKPRGRPQAQIESPPQDYVKAEPVREEISQPHRHYSNQQPSSNYENDVNIISTAEDPDVRHRTTPSRNERRPGYRGTSVNERPRYNPDIERGFLPVSDKPPREYSYTTRVPENDYPQTQRVYDRDYSYVTNAPVREYVSRVPEEDYSYTSMIPERDYPYAPRDSEREIPYSTQTPVREHSRYTPEPGEQSYVPNKERVYENTRGNRYQKHNKEISTTRPTTTTTTRPTKKPRPPPPRPTFPPFPTFPPPPKRIPTPPRPETESPKHESRQSEPSEYVTDTYSVTTEKAKAITNQKPKQQFKSEISEPRLVTENDIENSTPETTTRRKSRKRRPRPRRPKTTTPYAEDEDPIQIESITQASAHKEVLSRSTPSNYNRWRQQTPTIKKTTTTTSTPPTEKPITENSDKTEEYGSRINLFGRPRTRKPAVFTSRSQATTTTSSYSSDSRRVTKSPIASRTRKPFVKKFKKLTTTTESPDATENIARSDENSDALNYNSDINLQGLESATQLIVENMDTYQTTEMYKDIVNTTTESTTISYQEDEDIDTNEKSENFESTRPLSQKFQNRARVLKFGKPRLKSTDSPLDLNVGQNR